VPMQMGMILTWGVRAPASGTEDSVAEVRASIPPPASLRDGAFLVYVQRPSTAPSLSPSLPTHVSFQMQIPVLQDEKAELLAGPAIPKRKVEARRRWPNVSGR
jgi:hypothetical protein